MIEEEPKKKSKKDLEQERLSYAEAIRLEEKMNKEQRAQIAKDEEIARQWDEEERKRAMDEAKTAKKIDWNDPSVIRYHTQKMKPKTVAQARRNMIKYLKNQGNYKIRDFKGMSKKHGSEKQKSPTKEKSPEKVVEEEIDTQEELKEGEEEAPIEIESISTKFPIAAFDWMLRIVRIVRKDTVTSRPEGFDWMLWGDLHTLFEPDEDDEIWRD
ncbi:hypothetical protein Tco_0269102 [Tanacetum coccineum]